MPHVAVFDTAFHAQLPPHAFTYAVPYELYLQQGVRRYGFHGPSHQFMALSRGRAPAAPICRGSSSSPVTSAAARSVAAIDGGVSVETSMGMTPLEGLVMGTRSGDLDPAIPLLLARDGMAFDQIDELLNRKSGLAGLSGLGADFRDIQTRGRRRRRPRARLAIDVFVHRLRKYIGAYAAVLGGADAIVFTGGIGENSARGAQPGVRAASSTWASSSTRKRTRPQRAARRRRHRRRRRPPLADPGAGRAHRRGADDRARGRCAAWSGPTGAIRSVRARPIPVGVSVRHVHLSRARLRRAVRRRLRADAARDVTQPGQYVTRETVDLSDRKGEIRGVAIINPLRKETQVELARTDAFALGVDAAAARVAASSTARPGITLRGPPATVAIDERRDPRAPPRPHEPRRRRRTSASPTRT